jgi:DNA-binding transcriptional LysR family regulator
MELRNVKTFIKVAEIGNFSKAAADLGYAQSTVTMQIQTLERELGVTLFERNGKHAMLSAAGKEFLEYAYDLKRCEAMALERFSADAIPQGDISVGVMETICASHYGEIFRDFRKRFPKVRLKVVVATTLECMELLGKGKLDVILTVDKKINNPNWLTAYEVPTDIRFFCAANHPFAGREDVTIEELILENFIQIEAGCNYRQAFEQYLAERGERITNVLEIGYTRLIIDGVAENLGVSLLPRFTLVEALQEKKIALFSVKDYTSSMFMQVIYSKNRWATPALKAFMDMTREVFV